MKGLDNNLNKEIRLSLDELNPYICKAGIQNHIPWKSKYRKIYEHQFIFCCSGKANAIIEDRKYEMTPGTLLLIRPGIPHYFWKDEESPGEQYWVHFDFVYRKDKNSLDELIESNSIISSEEVLPQPDLIIEETIFENGFTFPEFLKIEHFDQAKELFQKIISCYELHEKMWQLECKIYLLQIFNIIINQQNTTGISNMENTEQEIIRTVTQYLYKNSFRKFYLNELCNVVGLSEDYIGRIFKKQVGMTIIQFVSQLRLQKAKYLLSETDLTIENISEIVGYSDVFYFSKVMKKEEGISPLNWRKKMTKGVAPPK